MVIPLGPGRFYGSALPRPRIYNDVKFSGQRVDPPASVMDPFLSWAREAHWSMGGLSFQRLRLQGRIEGSVDRLRAQKEKSAAKRSSPIDEDFVSLQIGDGENGDRKEPSLSPHSAPPAPRAVKRRRFLALVDESDGGDDAPIGGGGNETRVGIRRGAVRKLGDEFDRVAAEEGPKADESQTVALRTRSRRSAKVDEGDVVADVEPLAMEVKASVMSKGRKLKGYKSPLSGAARSSPRFSKMG